MRIKDVVWFAVFMALGLAVDIFNFEVFGWNRSENRTMRAAMMTIIMAVRDKQSDGGKGE